jgi:hypothetical protein
MQFLELQERGVAKRGVHRNANTASEQGFVCDKWVAVTIKGVVINLKVMGWGGGGSAPSFRMKAMGINRDMETFLLPNENSTLLNAEFNANQPMKRIYRGRYFEPKVRKLNKL